MAKDLQERYKDLFTLLEKLSDVVFDIRTDLQLIDYDDSCYIATFLDPLFKFYWLESTELTEDKQLIFKNRFNEILLRKWNSINSIEYSNNLIDSNNLSNSNSSIPTFINT